jgi:hypothetical protein
MLVWWWWHIKGWITVKEPKRLEREPDRANRHDRPILRSGNMVFA